MWEDLDGDAGGVHVLDTGIVDGGELLADGRGESGEFFFGVQPRREEDRGEIVFLEGDAWKHFCWYKSVGNCKHVTDYSIQLGCEAKNIH